MDYTDCKREIELLAANLEDKIIASNNDKLRLILSNLAKNIKVYGEYDKKGKHETIALIMYHLQIFGVRLYNRYTFMSLSGSFEWILNYIELKNHEYEMMLLDTKYNYIKSHKLETELMQFKIKQYAEILKEFDKK